MKMGAYHNRNPLILEETILDESVPHFSWIHPGNFFPATKISLNTFQTSQVDLKPALIPVPFQTINTSTTENNPKPATKPNKTKLSTKCLKKSPADTVTTPKQPKKRSSCSKKSRKPLQPGTTIERRNPNVVFPELSSIDFSCVPSPYCSCTGIARCCYKWGAGGWQSSCCTTNMSEYPLPMSSTRPGARMAGRKMSNGAYGKLLCRLAAEGRDLSHPIDLKNNWAKHGTNKFVTIK